MMNLSVPQARMNLSPTFHPPVFKGIKVFPDRPFECDFIIDKGDSPLAEDELEKESQKLARYFLAALAIPEKDLWVNLSPYEKNRMMPAVLSQTELGENLIAQDYLLKQLTATLISPEGASGKKFWEHVYEKVFKQYGNVDIPVNTFNKVWIVPDQAIVYEHKDRVFIGESHFKVLSQEDYYAQQKAYQPQAHPPAEEAEDVSNNISRQVFGEIILPLLEKEVNEGKHFAPLRQIYHSLILAIWFKRNLKKSLLGRTYVNQNNVEGIAGDKHKKKGAEIYQEYLQAFRQEAYDSLQEEYDPQRQRIIARKYFSGGIPLGTAARGIYSLKETGFPLEDLTKNFNPNRFVRFQMRWKKTEIPSDGAMLSSEIDRQIEEFEEHGILPEYLQPINKQEVIQGTGLSTQQIQKINKYSAGGKIFTIYEFIDFFEQKGSEIEDGIAFGIGSAPNRGDVSKIIEWRSYKSLARTFGLTTWDRMYQIFGLVPYSENLTKFLMRVENSGDQVVFFIPQNIFDHPEADNTASELRAILGRGFRSLLRNTYFVVGADNAFPKKHQDALFRQWFARGLDVFHITKMLWGNYKQIFKPVRERIRRTVAFSNAFSQSYDTQIYAFSDGKKIEQVIPDFIKILPNGNFFIVDNTSYQAGIYDPKEDIYTAFQEESRIVRVGVDENGHIYLALVKMIKEYSPTGTLLNEYPLSTELENEDSKKQYIEFNQMVIFKNKIYLPMIASSLTIIDRETKMEQFFYFSDYRRPKFRSDQSDLITLSLNPDTGQIYFLKELVKMDSYGKIQSPSLSYVRGFDTHHQIDYALTEIREDFTLPLGMLRGKDQRVYYIDSDDPRLIRVRNAQGQDLGTFPVPHFHKATALSMSEKHLIIGREGGFEVVAKSSIYGWLNDFLVISPHKGVKDIPVEIRILSNSSTVPKLHFGINGWKSPPEEMWRPFPGSRKNFDGSVDIPFRKIKGGYALRFPVNNGVDSINFLIDRGNSDWVRNPETGGDYYIPIVSRRNDTALLAFDPKGGIDLSGTEDNMSSQPMGGDDQVFSFESPCLKDHGQCQEVDPSNVIYGLSPGKFLMESISDVSVFSNFISGK